MFKKAVSILMLSVSPVLATLGDGQPITIDFEADGADLENAYVVVGAIHSSRNPLLVFTNTKNDLVNIKNGQTKQITAQINNDPLLIKLAEESGSGVRFMVMIDYSSKICVWPNGSKGMPFDS